MPLCRTSDDLHPKQYEPIWNGTIAKRQQCAEQRQPPPEMIEQPEAPREKASGPYQPRLAWQ